jgi:7-carboxy-7-deazaguanine synthase
VQRHEQTRINATVLRRLLLEYEYQVKFVIDEPQDVDEVEEFLGAFREIDRDRVLLMPQAAEPEELAEKSGWIRTSCSRRGLRFGPRLHIEQYGNVRGR